MQFWTAHARLNMASVGALYVCLMFSILVGGSQGQTNELHRGIGDRLRRFAEGMMDCLGNVGMSIALVKVSSR